MNKQNDDVILNQIHLPKASAVLGKGMLKNNALLSRTLNAHIIRHYPVLTNSVGDVEAYLGWGNKKSYQRAKRKADKYELPVYSIEDGFLRSIDSGINSRYALSMVIDDLGIYYDSTAPSRLESMICYRSLQANWNNQHLIKSQQLISSIIDSKLSKYNETLACPNLENLIHQTQLQESKNRRNNQVKPKHVLLIDQVLGDNSLVGACLDERLAKKQFIRMLKDVFKNHPTANIFIKTHPAGKQGYLTSNKLLKRLGKYKSRIYLLTEAMNPITLLKQVQHVYTVSSHMGFEALMLGSQGYDITVHTYGVSWYTGWGLTDDTGVNKGKLKKLLAKVKQRRLTTVNQLNDKLEHKDFKSLTFVTEQLFFASYLDYSHYVDPASQVSTNIQGAISWLNTNMHWYNEFKGEFTIYEFSRWKLSFVRAFIDFPKTQLFIKPKPGLTSLFHPNHYRVDFQNSVVVWGLSQRQKIEALLVVKNSNKIEHTPYVYCMEDGFIRSNGLGATLLAPLSVVIDKRGIYYNATQASDLEYLLQNCQQLDDSQQKRVEKLKAFILSSKVSKYNVGKQLSDIEGSSKSIWIKSLTSTTKKKILIVGQVEDDLSVQYCGSLIKTNAELIQRVVKDNPNVFLIYKPHPDVEAGLRTGKVTKQVLNMVDAVAIDVSMPECLTIIDEVHTISSLTGFEALLRDKEVVCYGLPFYAGWGLTKDFDVHLEPKRTYLARRQSRNSNLTLQQLIYYTLIEYPLYRLPNGYGLAQVEQVIEHLYGFDCSSNIDTTQTIDIEVNNPNAQKNFKRKEVERLVKLSTQKITKSAKARFMQTRHFFLSSTKDES